MAFEKRDGYVHCNGKLKDPQDEPVVVSDAESEDEDEESDSQTTPNNQTQKVS